MKFRIFRTLPPTILKIVFFKVVRKDHLKCRNSAFLHNALFALNLTKWFTVDSHCAITVCVCLLVCYNWKHIFRYVDQTYIYCPILLSNNAILPICFHVHCIQSNMNGKKWYSVKHEWSQTVFNQTWMAKLWFSTSTYNLQMSINVHEHLIFTEIHREKFAFA